MRAGQDLQHHILMSLTRMENSISLGTAKAAPALECLEGAGSTKSDVASVCSVGQELWLSRTSYMLKVGNFAE